MPYANERRRRKDADLYKNLINIIHVASFHPEKGRNTEVDKLFKSYDSDEKEYLNAKLDTSALNSLKALSAANQAQISRGRR